MGPALHGPLEVLSRDAVVALSAGLQDCEVKLSASFTQFGEDWFLNHCLKLIGVNAVDEWNLLNDADCGSHPWPCDSPSVAFQPFKTVESYVACKKQAEKHGIWPPVDDALI